MASMGVGRISLDVLVVGGVEKGIWNRVEREVREAVGGRVGMDGIEVWFTERAFEGDRVAAGTGENSCPESERSFSFLASRKGELRRKETGLSFVKGLGTEVVVNGIRQGASSKRKGDAPLGPKSRFAPRH